MSRLSDEEIEKAKEVDLISYLQSYEPQELIRVGPHDYKTRTHGSLCISDNGLWNWTSRGFGGRNALDYLVQVQGMNFRAAVQMLNEGRVSLFQPSKAPEPQAIPKPFALPAADSSNKNALEYLQKRGISESILQHCIDSQLLYQMTSNGYCHCVFVGFDGAGTPKSACIRSCTGSFRGEVSGSQKKYAFHLRARKHNCDLLEIYEAPIDALSGATLRQLSGRDWQSVHYLALGGLNYAALDQYLLQNPCIRKLRVCLDNDEAGRGFTENIIRIYQEKGYSVSDRPPRYGKDYNDTLLSFRNHSRRNRNHSTR